MSIGRRKGLDRLLPGQDNIYSDLTAGRIDAAFGDEVAASEGFLKQPVGKDYKFGGPAVKDEVIRRRNRYGAAQRGITSCAKR